ncbi:hypothetical protein FSP39_004868 [Pinctada imbricata]|uniref:G-protein coupled receptors family 1 profile domain-containing protein n=1 Tax=Pinctada imbricata TaxID=66713 RepID=A0AA88YAN5_PINIB|nr:hypothetical protein FSP39_004868 [Pinctada imbricata]
MNNTTKLIIPELNVTAAEVEEQMTNELISLILGIPIFIENSLAIFILSKCQKLMYQVKYLSLNLCLADCLTGLMLVVPRAVFEYVFFCKFKKYFNLVAIISSILTATAINVDRSMSIYLNMRYTQIITKRLVRNSCLATWIISLPLTYAVFWTPEGHFGIECTSRPQYTRQAPNLTARIILQTTFVCNIFLFAYMMRFARKIKPAIQDNVHHSQSETTKMLKKILAVSGCLFVFVSPVLIMRDVETYFPLSSIVQRIRSVTEFLVISKSFINPLLYIWTFYEVKYQIKTILFFWSPKRLEKFDQRRKQHFSSFEISTVQKRSEVMS